MTVITEKGNFSEGCFTAVRNRILGVLIVVNVNNYFWDLVTLEQSFFSSWHRDVLLSHSSHETQSFAKQNNVIGMLLDDRGDNGKGKKNGLCLSSLKYKLEGLHFCVFLKELRCSNIYRFLVIKHILKSLELENRGPDLHVNVECHLKDNLPQIIDYEWNTRMVRSAFERQHLDISMSWLSTLGGACSALGDYDLSFSERAAKISYQQLNIAVRIGDPSIVSRCRLYLAIALIQQCRFKVASTIIRHEYHWAHSFPKDDRDRRLINMCHGIWTKLVYEKRKARLDPTVGKKGKVHLSKVVEAYLTPSAPSHAHVRDGAQRRI